ncbi:DUF4288 domain-containing protein [Sporosarcina sp.]|uniref:DUF4288 domain-containing protein n=1 Tax=Sporosarcina sp. TaxID=49982 RepID=UPI00261DECBB|nr:DUF4288 domain-containing protein [Sporosarcina sp.]
MYGLYSVKLLFESIYKPNESTETVFEERILLVRTEVPDEISRLVHNQFPPDTYENSSGGLTTIKLVKILDVFDLVEDLEESLHFKEVYSRHLLFGKNTSVDEAIQSYALDK